MLEELGSAEGLRDLAAIGQGPKGARIRTPAQLREFLRRYRTRYLEPWELPAIHRAYTHVCRYEIGELIAYDRRLALEPALQDLATASHRVGQAQLRKLRPLRDQRLVRRYLEAVESGEAFAWHTLVYGLVLALYSLPIQQGLAGYAQQTVRSFIRNAAGRLQLSDLHCQRLLEESCGALPPAIDSLLRAEPIRVL